MNERPKIVELTRKADDSAVRAVEDLLENVKSGNVDGLVYIATSPDGKFYRGLGGTIDGIGMLGLMELAKIDIIGATLREEEES